MKWETKTIRDKSEKELHQELDKAIHEFTKHKDSLDSISPKQLKKLIQKLEKISRTQSKLYSYLSLNYSVDLNNSKLSSEIKMLRNQFSKQASKIRFFSHWFKQLPETKAKKYIENEELKNYQYYLQSLRKDKPYTRSEEVETVISYKDNTIDGLTKVYDIITNNYEFEMNGKTITKSELMNYYKDKDPKKRKLAYQKMLGKYETDSPVLSEIYTTIVNDWDVEALEIRGYESPISVRNHHNDASSESVQALLEATKENKDVLQEFLQLKHKINQKQGVDYEHNRYHVLAPYQKEIDKKYELQDCLNTMLDVYKSFDTRIHDAAKKLIDKKHIHAYPAKGKRAGAFCYAVSSKHTPYILLNHTDDLNSFFTLVHEFGHGVHGELARKQDETNYRTSLTIAETASVFSEQLLKSRLLSKSEDKEEKISILIHSINNYYSTIWRQIYFTIYEIKAHEMISEGASREDLQKEYVSILKDLFGDIPIADEFKHEWNYIPHIHHTPFYCYAYGWGNLSTLALYNKFENDANNFKDKYIDLLSKGGKDSAENLMKHIMGFDLKKKEFWQSGFDKIRSELEELKKLV